MITKAGQTVSPEFGSLCNCFPWIVAQPFVQGWWKTRGTERIYLSAHERKSLECNISLYSYSQQESSSENVNFKVKSPLD